MDDRQSFFIGVAVVQPLILQYYQLLPEHRPEEEPADWPHRFRKALNKFKRAVEARYTEATLERLLYSPDAEVRQAAILALGMLGSIKVNASVAARLHDDRQRDETAVDVGPRGKIPSTRVGLVERGAAAEIVTRVCELCSSDLRALPRRVTWEDVPIPFSPPLEAAVTVRSEEIREAIMAVSRASFANGVSI